MSDEEIRGYLREMRDEPVPADSAARVRMRVEERTRRPRWFGAWWKAAIVMIPLPLTVIVSLVLSLLRPNQPVRPAPEAKPVTAVQSHPAPVPLKSAPVAARRMAPTRPRPLPGPEPRKLEVSNLVRIETEDPDVVILLVAE